MSITQESKFETLIAENNSLKNSVRTLTNEISYLKEQLSWFQRQVFGKSSEKIIRNLDDNKSDYLPGFATWLAENSDNDKKDTKAVAAYSRKKPERNGKDKITIPDNLPVERIELDISDEEKICPTTRKPLVKIGEEISHKLAYTPGKYFIKEYVRPKYALPEGRGICVKEMPDSIIPKCRVDESLLADIFTKKFADHLPLYRISESMLREDVGISRQLLSQWVVRIGTSLKRLKDLMHQKILESNNVFIDESPIGLLGKSKGKVHQGYMWCLAGGKQRDPPYRIYQFKEDRKHAHAYELLNGYQGFLHSDKYGAYKSVAAKNQIIWCPCWAHIRRKFIEAESADPEFREWFLRKVRYLYMFEKVAWNKSPEQRLKIRQEKEIPIIDELIRVTKKRLAEGKILPKSKFREALNYFCGLIPYLKNYTQNPWSMLDNNVVERAIRPLAIGRKNWLFVGSTKGGEAAAVLLSLVQTCRALNINPSEYLEDILRRFMSHNVSQLDELLPDKWAKSKKIITS